MSLLVDLQLVPNRILEVVKARILANRAKLTSKQQMAALVKGATRPRPQRQKFNAKAIDYRRPEPAAIRGGIPVAGFIYEIKNGKPYITSPNRRASVELQIATPSTIEDKYLDTSQIISDNIQYNGPGGQQSSRSKVARRDFLWSASRYYSGFYAFPVDGKSCIVVAVSWSKGLEIKRSATLTSDEVTYYSACHGDMISAGGSQAQSISGGGVEVRQEEDKRVNCFRVATGSITPMSLPPGLMDSMPELLDWEMTDEDWEAAVSFDNSYSYESKFYELTPGELTPYCEPVNVSYTMSRTAIKKAALKFGSSTEISAWSPWGPVPSALIALGAEGAFVTPGVFGSLNGVTDSSPPGLTGSQIAEFYGLEDVAPRVSLAAVAVGQQPTQQKRFDIYPGLLPVPTDPNPDSKLRRNAAGLVPSDLNAVWDWGRPAYCRQRLKQAGFFPDPEPTP